MRKTYIFVYSNALGSREEVRQIVDSIQEIVNWIYGIPNCFFIQSNRTADELVDLIKGKFPGDGKMFFVSEITDNRQGYLSQDLWKFIKQDE